MTPCRIFAALTLLVSLAAPAQAASADAALQRFIDEVHSYQANFVQVQTDGRGEALATSAGRFVLQRPGRFRWEYQQPYEQLMVCDGEQLWLYEPDLSQATVRPAQAALAGTPAELLSQGASLNEAFTVSDAGLDAGTQKLELTPKSEDSDFERVELWLRDGAPQRMRFHDRLATVTDVQFTDIRINAAVPAELLKFSPPAGTDVIDAGEAANSAAAG